MIPYDTYPKHAFRTYMVTHNEDLISMHGTQETAYNHIYVTVAVTICAWGMIHSSYGIGTCVVHTCFKQGPQCREA
jgi:hypothetical protein